MKKGLKKGLMLIIAVMTLSVCFVFGVSAEKYTEGYYTYTVTDGTATITDVDESISGDVVIPDMLGGYPVTSIGSWVFHNSTSLTSITISDSVTSIGDSAFNYCTSLESAHYSGTQEQWNEVTVEEYNECLTDIIHMATDENNDGICDLCIHNHTYTTTVTEATCTKNGYITYTCSICGDTYSETTPTAGHTYGDWYREKNPTCTETGTDRRNCLNCTHYETRSVGMTDHIMNGEYIRTEATCTEKGVLVTYCTECGYEKTIAIEKLPHSDNDADGICDSCGQDIAVADCSCNCHKGGFGGFIWKILRIFYKIFKTKEFCACGVAHY